MLNRYFCILIILVTVLWFMRCTVNENHNKNKITLNEQMILGTWKDSNSIVTYFKNKTFDGWFGENNKRFNGYYSIVSDTLKISFATHNHNPEYIIEKMDSYSIEIRSIDDNTMFVKKKINILD